MKLRGHHGLVPVTFVEYTDGQDDMATTRQASQGMAAGAAKASFPVPAIQIEQGLAEVKHSHFACTTENEVDCLMGGGVDTWNMMVVLPICQLGELPCLILALGVVMVNCNWLLVGVLMVESELTSYCELHSKADIHTGHVL